MAKLKTDNSLVLDIDEILSSLRKDHNIPADATLKVAADGARIAIRWSSEKTVAVGPKAKS